ncbi:MAG: two-component sensor histidine kinase [Micromonosporaceae bacterium]|nr:two-component sensor histidine kinase [Micromonosporaceae bacterium]
MALAVRVRGRPVLVDGALAAVLSVLALAVALHHGRAVPAGLSLLVTAPLAVRRRWPVAGYAIQFTAALTLDGRGSSRVVVVAVLLGAYSVAAHGRWVPLSLGALLASCVAVALTVNRVTLPIPAWASAFAVLTPFALLGVTIRATRSRAEAATQRADALRAGQAAATRAAVAEERARIARELHDVVSHHVSVMVVQAGAAEKVLDPAAPGQTGTDLARRAVRAVGASGREAMAELRHLLGVLNPPGDGEPLAPQPGLDRLDALVERVRAAGQPVTLHRSALRLPRGVEITAYRIVQEALTNALRHAPGATTTVVVAPTRIGDLCIEVSDDGAAQPPAAPTGAGAGLVGLAERLALYGGTLRTSHRPGGGFQVSARIPIVADPFAAEPGSGQ